MEKKISVIIPTMWRANPFLFKMLKNMDSCEEVGEIIIIDNDKKNTPENIQSLSSKIIHYPSDKNLYFNPSVNLGVSMAKYDLFCILNDDVIFDPRAFKFIVDNMTEDMGMVSPLMDYFNRVEENESLIKNLHLVPMHKSRDGFGCVMFLYKKNFVRIPDEIVFHHGDEFMLRMQTKNNRVNYSLHNWVILTPMRVTTNSVPEIREIIMKDWSVVGKVFDEYGISYPTDNPNDTPIIGH